MARKLTAIGGGIFAGLFTVGVKRAGFDVIAHVEQDSYGVPTAKLNHPDVTFYVGRDTWPTFKWIDLMFCNPACAAWSAAGSGNKGLNAWRHDPRISQTTDLVDYALDVVRPRAFVTESVTNAWRHGRDFFIPIAQRWANAGYSVTIVLQNNLYLGAPQFRPRMFFVAHRHPLITDELRVLEALTCGQLLKGVKIAKKERDPLLLNERYLPLWEGSAAHKGMLRKTYDLMTREERSNVVAPVAIMRRLRANEVAPVIYGYRKHMHPTEPRWLHWREYLALFGLPDSWRTAASVSAGTMELGRSVLPAAGEWVATAVARGFEHRSMKKHEFKMLDLRDPTNIREEALW